MNRKREENGPGTGMKFKIMNAAIAFFAVVLLINLITLVHNVSSSLKTSRVSEDTLLYRIENEDYGSLVELTYENQFSRAKATETMEECYAVARYFEAASYYLAYEEDGQSGKAAEYRETMKEQSALMGELSYNEAKINKFLGVE